MGRRWLDERTAGDARRARRRGDRPRARGSVARSRDGRRAARRAARPRLPDAGRGRRSAGWRPLLDALAQARGVRRVSRWRQPRRGDAFGGSDATPGRSGSPPSGCRSSMRCIPRRPGDLRSTRPRNSRARRGRATRRWSRSCAVAWRDLGPVTSRAIADSLAWPRGATSRRRSPSWPPKASSMAGLAITPGAAANEWCDRTLLARIHRYTVQAAAAGDRAGLDAGLHALPVSLAARRAERAAAGTRRARRDHRAAAGLRGAGGGVGIGDPSGASRGLRFHLARRSVPVGPRGLDAADAAGARRRGGQRGLDPHDAGHAAAAPQRAAVDARGAAARVRADADRARARRRSPISCARTARRSTTRSSTAPVCCARRSKTRWPSSSRSARVDVGQLRRIARAADAVAKSASARRGQASPAHGAARHRRRGPLVADAARTAPGVQRATRHGRAPIARQETVEHVVHALLRRYGVVFWRMLQREAAWLPPWRELSARAAAAGGARRHSRRTLRRQHHRASSSRCRKR